MQSSFRSKVTHGDSSVCSGTLASTDGSATAVRALGWMAVISDLLLIWLITTSILLSLPSPKLVTLVVRLVHVVEEHLEASTEGNIVPSESEYVPVQAAAVGSGKKCSKN